jgi:hypothetical protein
MYQKQLNVRNIEQKIIFLGELAGQISDGNWENSRPYNHYQDWCLKYDEVVVNPSKVGRTHYVAKDNYNFTTPDIWGIPEIVERVLYLVDACRAYPARTEEFVRNHWDIENLVKLERAYRLYTKKQLMQDLRDLKTIVRTRIHRW